MVRKKVRTVYVFLLCKKKSKGKEKGKNSNLTFPKNYMVKKKVRTGFLLFKKSHGKAKGKSQILTFEKKEHIVIKR